MGDFYIGQVILFAGTFAPRGWAFCDGRLLSIAEYDALFSLLGTTYGGDGQTTFGLPDLRGAVPISPGQGPGRSPYVLGQVGGSESVTLTVNQMPAHNHQAQTSATIKASDTTADATSPNGAVLARGTIYLTAQSSSTMNPAAVTTNVTIASAGSSQPTPTMMPFLAVNYCICLEGLFPSRN
jgi:microcystin-dependent protein